MQIKTRSKSRSWWRAGTLPLIAALAMSPAAGPVYGQSREWVVIGGGYSPAFEVRVVQYLLREHGHTLAVDGSYARQTRERVRRFQHARGLGETGVVDDGTWERLIVPVRRGSRGNAVRALQSLLRALPNAGHGVALDGVFSAQTEHAVRRFQKSSGIPADGLVGPVTWNLLVSPESD